MNEAKINRLLNKSLNEFLINYRRYDNSANQLILCNKIEDEFINLLKKLWDSYKDMCNKKGKEPTLQNYMIWLKELK